MKPKKDEIYKCSHCQTRMYACLKPEGEGCCIYCREKESNYCRKRKANKKGNDYCKICGFWREIHIGIKVYCAKCKNIKGELKNV